MAPGAASAMDPAAIEALRELALDLRWSWNRDADALWERIDRNMWRATENPWAVLQTASPRRLQALLEEPAFRRCLDRVLADKRKEEQAPTWFSQAHGRSPLAGVAYFSMEYMLCEALPIYSGGLGNVAGDQLKAASELGVPVTAIGLLYAEGYFRQEIAPDGTQEALYPYNDPDQLPIRPLRDGAGELVRLAVALPGYTLWVRVWEARVGRSRLYLLDTNDPANLPVHRCITSVLYGGGPELRLRQEMVLGIAGWRLLEQLGPLPEICHLNEGHAAFAALERAAGLMREHGVGFEVARTIARAGTLFTTHTAVEAGFDRFPPQLMRTYLGHYAEEGLGIGIDALLALGRRDPHDAAEPFNMAYLAIRMSGAVNGVSALHGQVSRALFQSLFPRWPQHEVPVGHVTNGIHVPTWESTGARDLGASVAGEERWRGALEGMEAGLRRIDDAALWRCRSDARRKLVAGVQAAHVLQLVEEQRFEERDDSAAHVLDPDTLTLGFARRFASYKRPNLLLHDPERLARLLCCAERPVQLVIAGKAHPQDLAGQELIKAWSAFLRRPDIRGRAVFLEDYDMRLARSMVQGVDLWINTPRRPWEACGTSGMKILANGGLNLSELDGWWAEAYAPGLGWATGDRLEHGEDAGVDAEEAEQLYTLLEREIVPAFYERGAEGVPERWLAMVRESMAVLTPRFSANRAVREYTDEFYVPRAAAFQRRAAMGGTMAARIVAWRQELARHWGSARFGRLAVETREGRHHMAVEVDPGDLAPDAFRVQLYADPLPDAPAALETLTPDEGGGRVRVFRTSVGAARPASDYTPRLVPAFPDALVPLEACEITWQR